MEFEYKGKLYDTAKSEGEMSTNRLQVTKDKDLQLTVVRWWFHDDTDELLKSNDLQLLFDLAVMSARYQDIVIALSGLSYAGTYPDWVINAATVQNDSDHAGMLKDMLEESENDHAFVKKAKEFIKENGW